MKVISKTKEFQLNNTAVTLGKFDGMHKGHMSLVQEVIQSKERGLMPVLFTFDTSPYELVHGRKVKYILDNEEKYKIWQRAGIEVVIEYPFDKETMQMEPEAFINDVLLDRLGAKEIVVGEDFSFGKGCRGNAAMLAAMSGCYELKVKQKILYEGTEISSTFIRKCIQNGEIKKANDMLGRPFTISGKVMHGQQIGRTMGIPTINLQVRKEKILPPFGVYASVTEIDSKEYKGITNIGMNPTVSDEKSVKIETHLLDCTKEMYGMKAEVGLYEYIRGEKKFAGLDELKNQIQKDISAANKIFKP